MYRSNRDTGSWFQDDHKPMIQDRQHANSVGPGKYDKNHKHVSKEPISWNFGKIPFGSGDERFKTDYRAYFRPGPGNYSPDMINSMGSLGVQGTNPSLLDQVSQGGKNIRNLSPR